MTLSASSAQFIEDVKSKLDAMTERDRSFVSSVISTILAKGRISDRQAEVLQNAVNRLDKPAPGVVTEQVGDMTGLIALFDKAKEKLKYPAISLTTPTGQDIVLKVAGDRAKKPGSINVTDGGPYMNNVWFGRILRDGTWEQPNSVSGDLTEVRQFLRALADNPAEVAATYGKLTGRCCFCCKKLEDERSLAVGYGSTCAKNYGLPWGVAAARAANLVLPSFDEAMAQRVREKDALARAEQIEEWNRSSQKRALSF